MEGSIRVQTGLASGLDTGSLIQQMVQVERQPIELMTRKKAGANTQKSAFSDFSSKLSKLKDIAGQLDGLTSQFTTSTDEEFFRYSSKSSDNNVLTVTAGKAPMTGNYDIEVHQLARTSRLAHAGMEQTDTALASTSGNFSFNVGGEDYSIDIVANQTTLTDLKDAINALGGPVKASIIDSGADTNPYRLVISGEETGTENAVTIAADNIAGFSSTDFEEIQTAADAMLTIDGVEVQRSSNKISNAITNVTLELKKTTVIDENADQLQYNSTQATVARDDSAISSKIQEFISAANDVISFVKTQSYNPETKTAGVLGADRLLLSVEGRLRNMLSQPVEMGDGSSIRASDIGISVNKSGKLELDSDKFSTMMQDSPDKVRALFVEQGENSGVAAKFSRFLDNMLDSTDGPIATKIQAYDYKMERLDESITRGNSRVEAYQSRLVKQFTSLEKALSSIQSSQNYLTQQLVGYSG